MDDDGLAMTGDDAALELHGGASSGILADNLDFVSASWLRDKLGKSWSAGSLAPLLSAAFIDRVTQVWTDIPPEDAALKPRILLSLLTSAGRAPVPGDLALAMHKLVATACIDESPNSSWTPIAAGLVALAFPISAPGLDGCDDGLDEAARGPEGAAAAATQTEGLEQRLVAAANTAARARVLGVVEEPLLVGTRPLNAPPPQPGDASSKAALVPIVLPFPRLLHDSLSSAMNAMLSGNLGVFQQQQPITDPKQLFETAAGASINKPGSIGPLASSMLSLADLPFETRFLPPSAELVRSHLQSVYSQGSSAAVLAATVQSKLAAAARLQLRQPQQQQQLHPFQQPGQYMQLQPQPQPQHAASHSNDHLAAGQHFRPSAYTLEMQDARRIPVASAAEAAAVALQAQCIASGKAHVYHLTAQLAEAQPDQPQLADEVAKSRAAAEAAQTALQTAQQGANAAVTRLLTFLRGGVAVPSATGAAGPSSSSSLLAGGAGGAAGGMMRSSASMSSLATAAGGGAGAGAGAGGGLMPRVQHSTSFASNLSSAASLSAAGGAGGAGRPAGAPVPTAAGGRAFSEQAQKIIAKNYKRAREAPSVATVAPTLLISQKKGQGAAASSGAAGGGGAASKPVSAATLDGSGGGGDMDVDTNAAGVPGSAAKRRAIGGPLATAPEGYTDASASASSLAAPSQNAAAMPAPVAASAPAPPSSTSSSSSAAAPAASAAPPAAAPAPAAASSQTQSLADILSSQDTSLLTADQRAVILAFAAGSRRPEHLPQAASAAQMAPNGSVAGNKVTFELSEVTREQVTEANNIRSTIKAVYATALELEFSEVEEAAGGGGGGRWRHFMRRKKVLSKSAVNLAAAAAPAAGAGAAAAAPPSISQP